jgi:hypothetical protein
MDKIDQMHFLAKDPRGKNPISFPFNDVLDKSIR